VDSNCGKAITHYTLFIDMQMYKILYLLTPGNPGSFITAAGKIGRYRFLGIRIIPHCVSRYGHRWHP
jgi:hypothetical protein